MAANIGTADLVADFAAAEQAFRQGALAHAEEICRRVLARVPAHPGCLNLVGHIHQGSGHHRLAVKSFAKALALNDLDPALHFNIARSHQALRQDEDATAHFLRAIALGLGGRSVEEFAMQNRAVVDRINRLGNRPAVPAAGRLFGPEDVASIAGDVFFRCALESTLLSYLPLENLLTRLRRLLLDLAYEGHAKVDEASASFYCALAQQCFINEYVYLQDEAETQKGESLRQALVQKLADGDTAISPLHLAAVAAYYPLYRLPSAQALLDRPWPRCAAALLRRQVREPLQEAEDRNAIPALTAIDGGVSTQVMQQYEESPYPRWIMHPVLVPPALSGRLDTAAPAGGPSASQDILIAGCGTGKHSIRVAQLLPQSRVLAIDISRASLAYARRKTREMDLKNIDHAQADILNIAGIGRSFDRVEAVGVLHHLSDPKAGWQALLSLLRPGGIMRVGLYSEAGRRAYAPAFALIAERGYRAIPQDIRALRETVIRDPGAQRWSVLINTADFYSLSGCRDLLFNVQESRFTISEIAAFLKGHGLSFLGFELDPATMARFTRRFPAASALTDLACWNAFEADNPETFLQMYRFSVGKMC